MNTITLNEQELVRLVKLVQLSVGDWADKNTSSTIKRIKEQEYNSDYFKSITQ